MSGLKAEVSQSFYPLRTLSSPEAIAAREKEAVADMWPESFSLDVGNQPTAEILPPPSEPSAVCRPRTAAIIVALAIAIAYLVTMLVLAASSPLML